MAYIKLKKEKIAIIGAGISGLSAAYLLSKDYSISLYESSKNLGGHAMTLEKKLIVKDNKLEKVFFDIGFLVYNERNYPNFHKLLKKINVKTEKSNMSFSVCKKKEEFEYGSNGLLSITDNLKNIINKDFWLMLFDIFKFYSRAANFIKEKNNEDIPLDSFLKTNRFNKSIINNHIVPMCGAIWSTSSEKVLKMPARYILLFLDNHGLLSFYRKPQWRTISKGSINYVKKLESKITGKVFKNEKVFKVERNKKKIKVHSKNFKRTYDKVVFAIHADEVLKLLEKPTKMERVIFEQYEYEENKIYIHQDDRFMPKNKNIWSSWNVILNNITNLNNKKICVTYWINKLQNLNTKDPILVTLNPSAKPIIDNRKMLDKITLKHPLLKKNHYSLSAMVNKIQGKNLTYFTGAWLGYGFHEDGVKSSIKIAKLLNTGVKNCK